jgi:hypothetical protein
VAARLAGVTALVGVTALGQGWPAPLLRLGVAVSG